MEMDGHPLQELWSLDLNGANPTMLARTEHYFYGFQTHEESPIPSPPDPTLPFPTMGDVGEMNGMGFPGPQQP